MKPFWKATLSVLKLVCKFITWLGNGNGKGDTPMTGK